MTNGRVLARNIFLRYPAIRRIRGIEIHFKSPHKTGSRTTARSISSIRSHANLIIYASRAMRLDRHLSDHFLAAPCLATASISLRTSSGSPRK